MNTALNQLRLQVLLLWQVVQVEVRKKPRQKKQQRAKTPKRATTMTPRSVRVVVAAGAAPAWAAEADPVATPASRPSPA